MCCRIFSPPEQLLELHRGQGKDIYWRDSYICPTEEEYMEMVGQSRCIIADKNYKIQQECVSIETGGLFTLAVDLMQLFSDNTR